MRGAYPSEHLAGRGSSFSTRTMKSRRHQVAATGVSQSILVSGFGQRRQIGSVDDFHPKHPVVGMRSLHVQRLRPELADRPLRILRGRQTGDLIQGETVSVDPGAALARTNEAVARPENASRSAVVSDVSRDRIRRMEAPFPRQPIRIEEEKA